MIAKQERLLRALSNKKWQKFRAEVIEIDGHKCSRCGRHKNDGAVLQVHHKQYVQGKPYWDYPYEFCETLCKGCHAKEHGHIKPSKGWELAGWDDLGDLSGKCELCGTGIRYVFQVQHPKWPLLEVGEYCCDKLTETDEASSGLASFKREIERKRRFLNSPKWTTSVSGICGSFRGYRICVVPVGDGSWRLEINSVIGKKTFQTDNEAKSFVFDNLERIVEHVSKSSS